MTSTLVRGARVIDPHEGLDGVHDLLIEEHRVVVDPTSVPDHARVLDAHGLWALPGLIDLQVHFRQPGQEHKEDLRTGSRAALSGGVTTVVVMPNTTPRLDVPERVAFQSAEAARHGFVRILVAAAATVDIAGETLTDHAALQAAGAVALTDDGMPLLDDALMEQTFRNCRALDLLFMQHAEDTRMTHHVPMNLGPTSQRAGVQGQSSDAEGVIVERDIALAEKVGARYHVLHTSTARSLRAVRAAKARGAAVSCEASPHHLLLNDEACAHDAAHPDPTHLDPNMKMNPPLRSEEDRLALVRGLADGSVDAIATDHAPHTAEEKGQGFVKAPFGVVGLETAFAAAMCFVRDGTIPLKRAVELMTTGPAHVLRRAGRLGTLGGADCMGDVTLVDPELAWEVQPGSLFGRSKNSCFLGKRFHGRVVATFLRGQLAFEVLR